VLEVKGLKREEKFTDIEFDLRRGEILGFFGLVGSGRTEIMRAIFGADVYDQGEIIVNGIPTKINNPNDAIRYGVGFLPEDRKVQGLTLQTSVKENINLASYKTISKLGLINLAQEKKNAVDFVKKLRVITPGIFQKVMNLSGGNQQKVVIAKWLCKQCGIFIFDEPTVGIDVGAKREIYKLLEEILEAGNAIIIVSSYLPEIMGIADRIAVICEGRLVKIVPQCDFNEEQLLRYASGIECN
jgi:ribose transport system ATP-binding protein